MLGVIGDVVQDVVVWQHESRREATDTKSQVVMRRGGSAANVAAFAGRRHPTRFIGRIGGDVGGRALCDELAGHGVDVRVQHDPDAATGIIVVLIDERGERVMFPSRGANQHLQSIDPTWLDGIDLLHVTGYSFDGPCAEAVEQAIHEQHARGGRVSFDVSSIGLIDEYGIDAFLDLMQRLRPDIISANEDECRLLGLAFDGVPGPALARFPGVLLLARRGAAPTSVIRDGAVLIEVAVQPVTDVLDLTGAGDAFNAGFLTAFLESNGDIEASCHAAHALAARVLRSPGASEATA